MLEFSVLSSGSKANCLYVSDGEHRILVDCGLSSKKTCERLQAIGVEPDTISAIVVTHEHSDHIAGIPVFQRRFNPVLAINSLTLRNAPALSVVKRISIFESGCQFKFGNLVFEPFSVMHDASDPVGFRISSGDRSLAVVTDLGQVTDLVRDKTKGVDGLILECNHELEMLWECSYPWELKQRIRGRFGHLSNEQAADFFSTFGETLEDDCITDDVTEKLTLPRYVIASHISEKSNRPDIAIDRLRQAGLSKSVVSTSVTTAKTECQYLVAGPYEPTPLFRL